MKLSISVIAVWLLLVLDLCAEVRDGLWNGKPWSAEELQVGLAKRDPAALAERVYWQRQGWGGMGPDLEQEVVDLIEAAEKGSPLAIALLSRSYLNGRGVKADQAKGMKLLPDHANDGAVFNQLLPGA